MTVPAEHAPDSPHPAAGRGTPPHWHADLFGTFRIRTTDGTDVTPSGRKARALIAYVLATDDAGTSRERLATLLWSRRGEDQARASLRQTLYEIRGLTSGDAPPIAIDRMRVSRVDARITTDLARLDEAVLGEDVDTLDAVVGAHPDDFLADLDGIDPAFDDWLAVERTRRGDLRRRGMLAVAERRLATDDVEAASRLADRLLAADPADETAAQIAMRASHRRGDRNGIRRAFARLADALQRQLGVQPSEATDALHRRLMTTPPTPAASGTALSGSVNAAHTAEAPDDVAGDPRSDDASSTNVAPPPAARVSPVRRARLTLLVAVLAALAVAAVEFIGRRGSGVEATRRFLLVQPMQVAPDDQPAAMLRTGFSAELARVMVDQPGFSLREVDAGHDEPPDRTFVVMGDAQSANGVVQVGVRLLRDIGGPILWSTTQKGPVADVDALREQIAVKVADVVVCALDSRHTDLRAFRPDTLKLLFGACDLRRDDPPLEAARLLEQLTRQAPDYGHGWALLAMTIAGEIDTTPGDGIGVETRADLDARRAIAIDPHDGDAYFAQAFALTGIARWPQKMAILRHGLTMDPDNPSLAYALAVHLAQLGYDQEAVAWSERAIHGDPLSPAKAAFHARLLGMLGDGPEASVAFAAARRRFGVDPALALADFRFLALVDDYRRAAQLLANPDRGFHLQPDRLSMWNALITRRADPSVAHDAEAGRAFHAAMRAVPDINLWTLETLSLLGRVDEAYADADRMPVTPSTEDVMDTLFGVVTRPLRADPRFMTLAARLGLVTIWQQADRWPDFCNEPGLAYDCRAEAARALSPDARPLVTATSR